MNIKVEYYHSDSNCSIPVTYNLILCGNYTLIKRLRPLPSCQIKFDKSDHHV